MKNWFTHIFFPNWTVIEVFEGDKFEIHNPHYENQKRGERQNTFVIEYSKSRNQYRIDVIWGHSITADPVYHKALKKLAELNKTLINK